MKRAVTIGLAGLVIVLFADPVAESDRLLAEAAPEPAPIVGLELASPRFEIAAHEQGRSWLENDLAALQTFRPAYPFWQHIFVIPDGAVAFGGQDGRLLVTFPSRGDWIRQGQWEDTALGSILEGQRLPAREDQRRALVASLLEPLVGKVVHNPTRGNFVAPNARRYGSLLDEWSAIYERFGVPAEIGLAQAILESGLNPTIRSEARAMGFCQWLEPNWNRLKRFSPHVIEGHNQTTQALYCAAYLAVLAAKYGSFIPALSEHHAGAANVGRTLINGERLGGGNVREQYLMGSEFAVTLRNISIQRYRDLVRTYGPRSFRYSEMVFGNTFNVARLKSEIPQTEVYAMRTSRSVPIDEVTRRTGLSVDQVRRFNPALLRQVPANATLYLPLYVEEFGSDVAFWHRPPDPSFASVLDDFVRIDASFEEWDQQGFEPVLLEFQRRFRETKTEEGLVMSVVLEYVIDETATSRRGPIMAEFRTSPRIQTLLGEGISEFERVRGSQTPVN